MKVYRYSENVMALGWQDRTLILMLSSWHIGDTAPHHCWRNGSHDDVDKPVVISHCAAHMGAVDRSDHYSSSYSFTRKTLKWWRKLFFWLVEVFLVNSFLIYKEVHHLSEERHLRYRNKLIAQLLGNIRNRKAK